MELIPIISFGEWKEIVTTKRNAMLVIRISDGLVMDFKMLMKSGNCQTQNYWGTKKAGEIDQEFVNSQRNQLLINKIQKATIVS